VGPRTVLDAVVKRKIPSPRREWKEGRKDGRKEFNELQTNVFMVI
jgi:hypothetical protein